MVIFIKKAIVVDYLFKLCVCFCFISRLSDLGSNNKGNQFATMVLTPYDDSRENVYHEGSVKELLSK